MKPSFVALLVAAVAVPTLAACGDPAGPNGRYCDVVKRINATFDPMSRPELFSDPAVLRSGMDLRLAAYTDLVNTAPEGIVGDATIVRDGFVKISQALRERGDVAAAANDPAITALVNDKAFQEAEANVFRFSSRACKEPEAVTTTAG